ncbi:MAG: nuclear transport factor 2 family protein [Muribaculaceae bacterium]|nr:nuclear transport factor 2 family protein [Muribaculaceae bacterium]
MKKIVKGLFLAIGTTILVSSCGNVKTNNQDLEIMEDKMGNKNFNNATPEQLEGINKALQAYIDAAIKGDSKIAEPVFTDNATISHIEKDSLVSLPIQALFDYYNSEVCPQPASYTITACNVSDDVAIVAIDSDFGGTKFDDMFSMVKDGKDWKIVSKVFHVK